MYKRYGWQGIESTILAWQTVFPNTRTLSGAPLRYWRVFPRSTGASLGAHVIPSIAMLISWSKYWMNLSESYIFLLLQQSSPLFLFQIFFISPFAVSPLLYLLLWRRKIYFTKKYALFPHLLICNFYWCPYGNRHLNSRFDFSHNGLHFL